MIHLYLMIAVLLCWLIEAFRIKISYGKVVNLDKTITKVIAVVLFLIAIIIDKTWENGDSIVTGCLYIIPCALIYGGCRGTLYDPLLNIFPLKRKWWQDSYTTNSKTDKEERRRKISTYQQRALYLGVWIFSIVLFEVSKLLK